MTYIVGFDGSSPSLKALQDALSTAEFMNECVDIVYVGSQSVFSTGEQLIQDSAESVFDEGHELYDSIESIVSEYDVDTEFLTLTGTPRIELVDYINSVDDVAVWLGHPSSTTYSKSELISYVVSHTDVPVRVMYDTEDQIDDTMYTSNVSVIV